MTPGGREQNAPAGGSAVEPTTEPDAGAFFTRSLDAEARENSTVTKTARSSQHRVVDHSGVNYHLVAQASRAARKHLEITTNTDALVAAFQRLSRYGWLSQRIDTRTCYTMRPTRYTPAEHAMVVAELNLRKGFLDQSAAEHASVEEDAARMRRERVEPATEPGPAEAENDWFERTMTQQERVQWTAERASDETGAIEQLSTDARSA